MTNEWSLVRAGLKVNRRQYDVILQSEIFLDCISFLPMKKRTKGIVRGFNAREDRALPLNQFTELNYATEKRSCTGKCQTAMTTTARRGYVLTADFRNFRARFPRRWHFSRIRAAGNREREKCSGMRRITFNPGHCKSIWQVYLLNSRFT